MKDWSSYVLITLISISSISAWASETPLQTEQVTIATVDAWLKRADKYRIQVDEGSTDVDIVLYRQDKAIESNRYHVAFNHQGESRVEMLDTRTKGQKVLLLKEAMWLFTPRTKRAIRITPMQRLMGQASYGDVASMRWGDEYLWDEKTFALEEQEGKQLIKVGLAANRASSTYRNVVLWIRADTALPTYAEFYLASGKLMKSAKYRVSETDAQWVDKIEFHQSNKPDEYTVMTSSKSTHKQHPKYLFTRQGFIK